jgi:hypothetical protein
MRALGIMDPHPALEAPLSPSDRQAVLDGTLRGCNEKMAKVRQEQSARCTVRKSRSSCPAGGAFGKETFNGRDEAVGSIALLERHMVASPTYAQPSLSVAEQLGEQRYARRPILRAP